jgi:hypothetical protein
MVLESDGQVTGVGDVDLGARSALSAQVDP